MIIVWGFKTYVRLLGIVMLTCSHCSTPAAQRLVEQVRKFTLFWIPLFPISRKNYLTCTFCGSASQVPKEQVPDLLQYATQPGAQQVATPAPGGDVPAGSPYPAQPGPTGTPYQQYPQPPYGQQG